MQKQAHQTRFLERGQFRAGRGGGRRRRRNRRGRGGRRGNDRFRGRHGFCLHGLWRRRRRCDRGGRLSRLRRGGGRRRSGSSSGRLRCGRRRRGGRRFTRQLDRADGGTAAARQGGFVLLQALERLGPARRHARAFRHEVGAAIAADRALLGLGHFLRVRGPHDRARGQSRHRKIRPQASHFFLHRFIKDAEISVTTAFVTTQKCPYLYEHRPNAVDRFGFKDPRHADGCRRDRKAHQEPYS